MSLLDLDDAKVALRMQTDADDQALQKVIDSAEAIIGREIGALTPDEFVERIEGCGRTKLALRRGPVAKLLSVTVSGGTSALDVDDLFVTESDIVERIDGGPFPAYRYVVTYRAGYDNPPADLLEAILELTRHLWESRRGALSRRGSGADADAIAPGYLIPNRVASLLAPFRRPGIA